VATYGHDHDVHTILDPTEFANSCTARFTPLCLGDPVIAQCVTVPLFVHGLSKVAFQLFVGVPFVGVPFRLIRFCVGHSLSVSLKSDVPPPQFVNPFSTEA
jgi:hypothetical protein